KVYVDPVTNPSDWMLMLYKDYPTEEPAAGGEVTYGLTLYGNSEDNGLDLSNVAISVTYPANAEVMDAGGGTVDMTNHTITWQQGNLITEEMAERWITLHYPDAFYSYSTSNGKQSTVDLTAKASANVSGMEGVFSITADLTHGFGAPEMKLGSIRSGENLDAATYCGGERATYTIYGMENKGNVSYKKATIVVDLPDDLFLQFVETGQFNMDVDVKIQFQVEGIDGWQDWATVSALKSTRLKVSDLDYIVPLDKIRWVFTEGNETIKPGFSGRDTVKFEANVIGNYGNDTDVTALLQAWSYENAAVSATSRDVLKIRTVLPDNLPEWRREIVETSFILQGKVEYYLGGKSYVIGWDDRWGTVKYNSSSRKTEPYGLDCSGFAVWVLINAGFDPTEVRSNFGIATYYQWPNCEPLTVDEILPGDMVFRQPPSAGGMNHVGIVVGWDKNGTLLVAHCAGSYNTVVVTPYDGTFYYMRRPYIYND
ncbi:MAG: NlpC/P60 family protein, partial [Eubacteriales bacterium]